MMKAKTFANVWDALEDSPEDAATMTMRSDVMAIIAATVRGWNITAAEAANRLGMTEPRLDDLLGGKISKFSLDTLLTLATRAGLKVTVDVRAAAGPRERGPAAARRMGGAKRYPSRSYDRDPTR